MGVPGLALAIAAWPALVPFQNEAEKVDVLNAGWKTTRPGALLLLGGGKTDLKVRRTLVLAVVCLQRKMTAVVEEQVGEGDTSSCRGLGVVERRLGVFDDSPGVENYLDLAVATIELCEQEHGAVLPSRRRQ